MLVICEFAEGCNSKECGYTKPCYGNPIDKAMCGHIGHKVDVIEYNEVSTNDPNYIFNRKKNGF